MGRRLLVAIVGLVLAGPAQAASPLLGIRGDPARFQGQTGQDSLVVHAILGWGQGQRWGKPFEQLLPFLAPDPKQIPMLGLGTAAPPPGKREAISPGAIAAGAGDAYLFALNAAIARWNRGIYIRPFGEMNGSWNLYSAFNANGTGRNAAHSTAAFRKAFARVYLIVHGGKAATINARLRSLGMPPIRSDLPVNPFPRVRVIWNPQGAGSPDVPGNEPQAYYPGRAYVDVIGNDIYSIRFKAEWAANDRLFAFARQQGKPYAFPEWGLWGIDDPTFVRTMCAFLRAHPQTELAAYFESAPGSIFDLAAKPRSRQAYRQCLTPLGRRDLPAWARPTAAVRALTLRLTPSPDSGDPPLAVRFSLAAKLTKPIVRWEIAFGDGKTAAGSGPPPASLAHTYAAAGVYQATLIVYEAPPFTGTAVRFLTSATVEVGSATTELLRIQAKPASGRAPLAVSFQVDVSLPRIAHWQLVLGDGSTREGDGKPAHFLGHTYAKKGSYRAILIVYEAPPFTGTAVRFITYADVTVR